MTDSHSVTSSVAVTVDPATAFSVFTEELDCWWVQGPINFYDSSRAYGMRIEPGVGGRIVEVYDDATGDGLELARITVWEPGRRLTWQSVRDDVEVDVQFEARGARHRCPRAGHHSHGRCRSRRDRVGSHDPRLAR